MSFLTCSHTDVVDHSWDDGCFTCRSCGLVLAERMPPVSESKCYSSLENALSSTSSSTPPPSLLSTSCVSSSHASPPSLPTVDTDVDNIITSKDLANTCDRLHIPKCIRQHAARLFASVTLPAHCQKQTKDALWSQCLLNALAAAGNPHQPAALLRLLDNVSPTALDRIRRQYLPSSPIRLDDSRYLPRLLAMLQLPNSLVSDVDLTLQFIKKTGVGAFYPETYCITALLIYLKLFESAHPLPIVKRWMSKQTITRICSTANIAPTSVYKLRKQILPHVSAFQSSQSLSQFSVLFKYVLGTSY